MVTFYTIYLFFIFLFIFNYNEHSEVVNQYKNLYPMVYTKWGKRLYII